MWIALLDLAAMMYFSELRWGILGLLFRVSGMLWTLLGINVIALVAWEFGLAQGVPWLNRWGARAIAVLAGSFATAIGMMALIGSHEFGSSAILVYLAWIFAVYWYYRHRQLDIFMLAGAVLSAVLTTATFLGRRLLTEGSPVGFLFIGLVIIGMSAAGAWWIRQMLQEQQA